MDEPTARPLDAIAHLDAAIAALTNNAVEVDRTTGRETEVSSIELSVGRDLLHIERQMFAKGSLLGEIGECVNQALIEVIAARNALRGAQ